MDYGDSDAEQTDIIDITRLQRKERLPRRTYAKVEPVNDVSILPKRQSKKSKLNLKSKLTSKSRTKKSADSEMTENEPEYVTPPVELPFPKVEKVQNQKRNTGTRDYHEYGDSVNGYKFVKHKKTQAETKNAQRHSIFHQDAYEMSFEAVELKQGVDKYSLDQLQAEPQLQTYQEYIDRWDKLSEVTSDTIPWPNLENSFSQLSSESLKKFFENDKKIWKAERIRWHPDNLNKRLAKLQGNDKLSLQITEVFQMINDIWEREMK